MPHDVLIALHALAGVVCFGAGALSLRVSAAQSWRFQVFVVSLAAMWLFLLGAVAVDWSGISAGTRWLYAGLLGLGLYMLWRGARARARLRTQGDGWRPRYIDDLGFTLISLFDGFVIVSAMDLSAPAWLVVIVAVAGVAASILAVRRIKATLGTEPANR